MPARNIDSYLQDARNNFEAERPATICTDANQSMGQCQNVHISTNCYYGYHDLKTRESNHVDTDCEMVELEVVLADKTTPLTISRKRSADDEDYPRSKRVREEVQREKTNEPETIESVKSETSTEDVMESLYWNIHDDSSMCSLVGTRSSPSHSASAFNVNISTCYTFFLRFRLVFSVL